MAHGVVFQLGRRVAAIEAKWVVVNRRRASRGRDQRPGYFDLRRLAGLGNAHAWDEITEDGDVSGHDAALRFRKGGRTLALATIFRGRESLLAEAAMEQGQSP